MPIQLTEQEKELFKQGKLDISQLEEHRKVHPVRSINHNEVDEIKQLLRETNILYKDSIQKNKDLYEELKENRAKKEELRNKIAELRIKKKQLLGLI